MNCKSLKNDNIPWVEKYRPPTFNDIVLSEINRELLTKMIDKKNIPNLLFYGPPGTGKTTTIVNLINEYNKKYYSNSKGNIIHLNASDDRGIDVIRTQIYQFVKTQNMIEPGLKFVILDEVDYMTKTAQYALKHLLQTCGNNVRFGLICNYISKVDESLKNEFICIRFNQLPQNEIKKYILNISIQENIEITTEDINDIQQLYNSDMRSMINYIQLNQRELSTPGNNVLSSIHWKTIHMLFCNYKNNDDKIKIIDYLNNISIKYNEDINTILKKYFNYVIRTYKHSLSSDFYNLIEVITHVQSSNIYNIIEYIIQFIPKIYNDKKLID